MSQRKDEKRLEAEERQKLYDALSLDQKIALAEKRGGKKELERLTKQKQDKESK